MPPPEDGARGIEAHRDTWPPFFAWRAQGARFDISLETTPGTTSRSPTRCCGAGRRTTARHTRNRLRLAVGLRTDDGRWVVTHEHSSFPDRD